MGYTLGGYNNPNNNINTNYGQGGAGGADPIRAPLGSTPQYNPQDPSTWSAGAPQAAFGRGADGLVLDNYRKQADWMGGQSGINPWENNGQQAAEERNNYYYGGSPNGAANFNAEIAGSRNSLASDYNQGANNAAALQGAANGRDASQFLYNPSIGANGQDRRAQLGAYNSLAQFAAAPQGPSAAQGQLAMATDANMQNSLALARSGRGLGQSGAALHQALGTNAIAGQQAANQAAMLKAQEFQQFQQNQLNAYGQMGNIAGQARTGDVQLGSYVSGTQQAAQNANDQASLGYGNQYLGALGGKASSDASLFGVQSDVNKAQLTANNNYEGMRQNYFLNRKVSNGTDYSPYFAAGGALIGGVAGAFAGGPGGAIAGASAGSSIGGSVGKAV